ncbi:hypothetical protein OIE68_19760 [Nocardia vinacea]|uniref:hypothetical protein n=1 Tax=Nocardia vinacea TaxID=96468 RepID=UPI002E0EFE4C|nr:hypothetical protein OIE68_19760 [Nocardia vinacea]
MPSDPDSIAAQVRSLRARAERAGYRLVRNEHPPFGWKLLAAEGDECVFGGSLDRIDVWLTS